MYFGCPWSCAKSKIWSFCSDTAMLTNSSFPSCSHLKTIAPPAYRGMGNEHTSSVFIDDIHQIFCQGFAEGFAKGFAEGFIHSRWSWSRIVTTSLSLHLLQFI